jgi:RNA polymerase sigma-70 factor (ECF subfamily)
MAAFENNTEKEIFTLLQKGNVYAYELIFRRYYVSLSGFAARFVQQPDAAEEIVQNIFLKLWEKKESLSIETSLKSYLFRAVYNGCNNHLAHTKIQNKYISLVRENILRNEALSDPVMDSLAYKELNEKITDAIERLPTECKKIFKMSRFDGLKYAEIAESLQISVKTVETQISRALLRLRVELKEFLVQA